MIFRYVNKLLILAKVNYDLCRLIQDFDPNLGVKLNKKNNSQGLHEGINVFTLLDIGVHDHVLPPTC